MILFFDAATHTGNKRTRNEDRYVARKQADGSLLMAVADGMGGMPGGEKAAELAIAVFVGAAAEEVVTPEKLLPLATSAHSSILHYAAAHPRLAGMGTTLSAAVVRENMVFWIHVGDSRLYILRDGTLRQATTDHRFLSSMIEDGDITVEEARNHPLWSMLDQCLGCAAIKPEQGRSSLKQGDAILLCTDGLYEELPHNDIEQILLAGTPDRKAAQLLEAALRTGGKDNITIIVVEVPAHRSYSPEPSTNNE